MVLIIAFLPWSIGRAVVVVVVEFTITIRSSRNENQWRGIDTINGDLIGKGDIPVGRSLDM